MRLVVVTDIHDQPGQTECISARLVGLSKVSRFALNELCDQPGLSGGALHTHLFVQGGIEDAVDALKKLVHKDSVGLGYSAGGTALWRLAQRDLSLKMLFCVSSTRLREVDQIKTPTSVSFGECDENKPTLNWLQTVPDKAVIFKGVGHDYYCDPKSQGFNETCVQISNRLCENSVG